MWVAFVNAKATHIFFSKNISIYAIFNDQSFNDMLTNNIVSFKQLGPGWQVANSVDPHSSRKDYQQIFLFLNKNIPCRYSLKAPYLGASD